MLSGCRRYRPLAFLLALTVVALASAGARAQMPDGWSYTPHSMPPAHPPKGATARCRDGRWSHLPDPRRACRGHGGVLRWLLRGQTDQSRRG